MNFHPLPPHAARTGLALMLTAALATLAACDGSGGGNSSTQGSRVTVAPSLGAMYQTDVSLTCAATGVLLGSASSGSNGIATLDTTADCDGPVLVSVSARVDGSSSYYDEAQASALPLPAGSMLRALIPGLQADQQLGVTTLTEIATRQALAAAGGSLSALTAAQVTAANSAVAPQVLGVSLDILAQPTLWSATLASGSLSTSVADRYAYYLAALAHMASGESAPALAALQALAADLADGTLDGGSSGGFSYAGADLASLLQQGLTAMKDYASAELQQAVGVADAPVALASFSPASGAVGDSITLDGSGFDPDPFHMQVKFSNNIAAEVVSSSATRLVVKVPAGAVSGPITVINGLTGQSDTSDTAFTVTDDGGGSTSQWVSRASPSSYLLNGVAYGYSSHTFVAVGYGQTILTSSDGLSWSRSTAPDAEFYEGKAVAWTGSRFVMVGDQSYGSSLPALIATSPDGITWTRRSWSQSVSSETLVSVATGGGKITAVGLNGSVIASSDGGLTWVSENPGASVAFSSVTGTDSTRVAVGRDSSNEGVILVDRGSGWTRVSGLSSFVPRQVIWAGGQFLAVGSTSVGLGSPAIATSPDGTTWTRRALAPTEAPAGFPLSAVHLKDGVLYAAGDNFGNQHVILQSNNGGASWQVVHQAQLTGIAMLAGFASSAERIVSVGGVKSVTLP